MNIEKLMFGFIESQVLFVCPELKIFDYLCDTGSASLEQVSHALRLPASSLERLLICAHCIELLQKENDHYQMNPEWVTLLYSKSANYCGDKFSHYYNVSYKVFDNLLSAVKEDKAQTGSTNVYDYIYANETTTANFLSTMWASGYIDSVDLCRKFSFSGYNTLIDLGGATGSFAVAAMQENPGLHAIVMDLPPVYI